MIVPLPKISHEGRFESVSGGSSGELGLSDFGHETIKVLVGTEERDDHFLVGSSLFGNASDPGQVFIFVLPFETADDFMDTPATQNQGTGHEFPGGSTRLPFPGFTENGLKIGDGNGFHMFAFDGFPPRNNGALHDFVGEDVVVEDVGHAFYLAEGLVQLGVVLEERLTSCFHPVLKGK